MTSDDELRRRLRALESELESGNLPLRPSRPDARRGVRMRPAAAGLGMAVSIAATVGLFAQVLPSRDAGSLRPGSASSPAVATTPEPASSAADPSTEPSATPTAEPSPVSSPPMRSPTPAEPAAADCYNPGPRKEPGSGVSITAEVDPAQARRGDTVTLRAVFRNEGSQAIENWEGNPRADFAVYNEAGTPVWVYSDGKVFTQELRSRSYAPGEEVAVETTWDLRTCGPEGASGPLVEPGTYRVRAIWTGEQGGWSGFTTLTIA